MAAQQTVLDLSSLITGRDSNRKKHNNHKIKMTPKGRCPIDGCNWKGDLNKGSTFSMHISRKHQFIIGTPIHTYTCGTCLRIFNSRALMNQHIQRAHEPWKFKCRICKKSCPNKSSLMTHHVGKHMKLREIDCVDVDGCCVNCGEKRPKTGHLHHMAKCLGIEKDIM